MKMALEVIHTTSANLEIDVMEKLEILSKQKDTGGILT